jgi:hypothetical protein
MKKKLDALKKIEKVQAKLHEMTVWKLAAIDQKRGALEEAQREMIEAVDRHAINHGPLLAGATRRLRAVDKEIATTKSAYDAQSLRALDQGSRAKLAERLVESAAAKHRAQDERKGLAELIERTLRGRGSSPA